MPLESLSNEQINIHDLTLEQEKKPELTPGELYKKLKDSTFYCKENGLWREMVREDELEQIQRAFLVSDSFSQLLGVLCEYQFDPIEAKNIYEKLKSLDFYSDEERWHEENNSVSDFVANSQLAGVLCEHLFDPNKAAEVYGNLKNGPIYNGDTKEWNDALDPDGEIKFTDIATENQLLGVLCENLFDPQEAKKIYERLKMSNLYIKETGQWDNVVLPDKEDVQKNTNDQFLGMLCENLFNKEYSEEQFIKCKKSVLFDKKLQLWNHQTDLEGNLVVSHPSNYKTKDQLLGILCECLFKESDLEQTSIPPLPETRKY